ncbi:integrase/recombinase xerD homolog [Glandiceps talaboti]
MGLKLADRVESAACGSKVTREVNPELHRLADILPYYLLDSRSDNTVKKYFSYFKKWETFISPKGQSALPANPIHVALFITHLLECNVSASVISSHVYGIKWAHSVSGLEDPTTHPFIISLVETSKRTHQAPKSRKDPVSVEEVRALCEKYKDSTDLLIIRDLCMILLCFTGFLRFNEVSNLRCCDVTLYENYFRLNITHSKTDQYRQGNSVVIAKVGSFACQFALLQRYSTAASINFCISDFLFKPVVRSKSVCKLVGKNKKLSYTRARETIVSRLREVCGASRVLGLHSLRAGGATAAANAAIGDRCWKRHGRWKSDTAKDGYIEDSLEHRLEVTQKSSVLGTRASKEDTRNLPRCALDNVSGTGFQTFSQWVLVWFFLGGLMYG